MRDIQDVENAPRSDWEYTREDDYCRCDHCQEQGDCFGCTSGICP